MKKILLATVIGLSLISCGKNSREYKQLSLEADSLRTVNAEMQGDFDEMLSTLNEVEDGFAQIKEAENYLVVQSKATGEMNTNMRDRIKSDMQLVAETLRNNRDQLAKLQKQLDGSRYHSTEMRKTLDRLTAELENKTAMISSLQEELAKRDIRIQELDDAVSDLSGRLDTLSQEAVERDKTLKNQEKELNTVWYVYGTRSELKKQNIVSGGGIFKATEVMKGDFNKDYFIKEDKRTLKEIPLYAKGAKILTNQPEDSYKFVKDNNGNLTLVIEKPAQFWQISRYLVIQVE